MPSISRQVPTDRRPQLDKAELEGAPEWVVNTPENVDQIRPDAFN